LGEYFDFRAAFRRTEAESSAFYGRFARFYGAAANIPDAGGGDVSGAGYLPLAVYLSMGQQHDYSSPYRTVKVPVLVIHGSEDLQPEAVSRAFAAWFPASQFVRIEGAGHFVFNEQPKRFAQAVGEFLREAAR
jgi:proline iminopeptidase